jgi:hypothetical protein
MSDGAEQNMNCLCGQFQIASVKCMNRKCVRARVRGMKRLSWKSRSAVLIYPVERGINGAFCAPAWVVEIASMYYSITQKKMMVDEVLKDDAGEYAEAILRLDRTAFWDFIRRGRTFISPRAGVREKEIEDALKEAGINDVCFKQR